MEARWRKPAAYRDAQRSSVKIPMPPGNFSSLRAGGILIMSKIRVMINAHNIVSSKEGVLHRSTVPKNPATSSVTKTPGSFFFQYLSAVGLSKIVNIHDAKKANNSKHV